jgi:hypothetical protein
LYEEIRGGRRQTHLNDDLDEGERRDAPPLPDKPSIAVLPFLNVSGDPMQAYFSDGITNDMITELSRFRSMFVIARHSSFAYRGRAVKVQQIGRELGVHYVVEGSVSRVVTGSGSVPSSSTPRPVITSGRTATTARLRRSLPFRMSWCARSSPLSAAGSMLQASCAQLQ